MSGFFSELKRRNVIRVAGLYAVSGWLLLQVADVLFGLLDVPDGSLRLVFGILLLGFPVALAFAWAYELTPEGLKRDRDVDRSESVAGETGRKLNTLTLAVGVLAIAAVVLDRLVPEQATHTVDKGPAATAEPAEPDPANVDAGEVRPSIGVLPFENRSRLEDDAFFVDGIHDDILTQLSKISALKVISRTSVERFRGTDLPMQEIAGQLGVTKILEGGVQRSGDRVRINVQLIDAGSDEHLWAETYDRELTAANIFAIQSEVASAISEALKTTLTEDERARVNAVPTNNLVAWEAYQIGQQRMAQRNSQMLIEAERYFREAIELDPDFALAHVALADSLILEVFYSAAPRETTLEQAEAALARALQLDAALAEALASSAMVTSVRGLKDRADSLFRRAIELSPNYATAHQWFAVHLRATGREVEAFEHARRAAELDPLSAVINGNLAEQFEQLGRWDEAEARWRKVIEIDPSSPIGYYGLGALLAYSRNRFAAGMAFAEKAAELDPGAQTMLRPMLRLDLGDEAKAAKLIESALAQWPDGAVPNLAMAGLALYRGDTDAMARYAQRSFAIMPELGALTQLGALTLLRDADLASGNLTAAIDRYEGVHSVFSASAAATRVANAPDAIGLALVLQRSGANDRASELLNRSEQAIGRVSRLGVAGYGLADVQIHTLRGERAKALAALREAAQAGWRGPYWRYYRDFDPALALIRGEPEFMRVFAGIERDMAAQRKALEAVSGEEPASGPAAAQKP